MSNGGITSRVKDLIIMQLKFQVWVTVEPCIMCASALHSLHVASIMYGCKNDRFGGHTSVLNTALLYPKPSPMIGGLESDQAMQLLKDFYKGTNPNAPHPNIKKDTT
jgi:tRNA-specific adenosine deaminase 2